MVGPTAAGKTALSLALADGLPIEILVADSRQVYRGLDVGTAKVGPAERRRVPHHLLDLVEPDQRFTVADWADQARELVPAIVGRGAQPTVVGGTGLYVSALVDGFDFAAQPWSPEVRQRLADELETEGLAVLAERLGRLDPGGAARIDLHNPRRVLRALERAEIAGGGAAYTVRAEAWPGRLALLGLRRPVAVLDQRIGERATDMFANGLLEETRALLERGLDPALPALTGHGYAEAARHLAGEWSLEEAIATTARRVRRYARRQLSWFGRDRRIVWLDAGDEPADAAPLVRQGSDLLRRLTLG
ncbi:MAG TPA: tRNA (adenosine(37)-N6)-dimethylallyltransferase MiaA [Candidatus Limnocylindria bacterium]|jgi:tRNA dimethylallyltransferase